MLARFFSAALVLAAALPALAADDVPLPPLTPKGEYLVMTQDDATSSSKCIGNPATPMCAVETLLACFVRGKDHLCQSALGVAWDKVPDFVSKLDWPPVIYRVVRREVLDDRHFPWRPQRDMDWRPGELDLRAADIRIDLVRKECWEKVTVPCACEAPARGPRGATAYIVRHEKGRWAVVTWGSVY